MKVILQLMPNVPAPECPICESRLVAARIQDGDEEVFGWLCECDEEIRDEIETDETEGAKDALDIAG